jgi:hypothetical protein
MHRLLRMGFVRIAYPEGDKDRQSSIWTGDPMEKDGGHICMLDPFFHLGRPLLCALMSLRFPNGQPRSATKTCLGLRRVSNAVCELGK